MDIAEIKKKIIDKINQTNSEALLADIYRWLELDNTDKPAYIFTEEESAEIDNIVNDVDAGNYLTKDEANSEIKKWLKK